MKITMLTVLLMHCAIIFAQTPKRYDIVINEIMINPSSARGLPDAKYIELYNVSRNPYNLKGWSLSDGSNTAKINADFMLEPDSFVAVTSNSGSGLLSAFGKTIGVTNFPTLHVSGDVITLYSAMGNVIHSVAYNKSWYGNDTKAAGGWSLEMVDAHNACTGYTNWKASANDNGGTPCRPNAVAANLPDEKSPVLLYAYALDSLHTTLVFNESLDSLSSFQKENFFISDGIGTPVEAIAVAPLFNSSILTLPARLKRKKTYTVTVKNIRDCSGNTSVTAIVKTGLAEVAGKNDIIINEILFNAPDNGAEYVELYNRSEYPIDCNDLLITTRNATGNLATQQQLHTGHLFFYPGEYKLLTGDTLAVQQAFLNKNAGAFIQINSMPVLPNTDGTIVLLNFRGDIVDELNYNENWHFPLITNPKGVALERISFSAITQDKNNWHSAAASAGYGTPGYQNSQFTTEEPIKGDITITPAVFSPDSDGNDDFLSINYRFPEPGYVCNITVFDAAGRPIRYLVRNGLCGRDGYFRWDGLDEKNQPLRLGIYVVLTEMFNLQGKTKKIKKAVTLARRLY
jgi:hypothetical protein